MKKLMGYVHQAVGDFGALVCAALINVGDKLGLFQAMAGSGPMTAAELAQRTGTTEHYVREWANGLAAAGYLDYAGDGRYELNPEQPLAFVEETSPAYVMGGFQGMLAATRIIPKAVEAFRTGDGIGWHEHDPDPFQGTERFFRPGYGANLVQSWIPALDGAEAKLRAGGKVADVGCGYGASTIIMAEAFPESQFWGFDYHEPSIRHAREAAAKVGLSDPVMFEVGPAKEYPGTESGMRRAHTAKPAGTQGSQTRGDTRKPNPRGHKEAKPAGTQGSRGGFMQLRRILAMAAAATVPLIALAPAVSASAGTVSASAGTVHHPKLSHDVYVTGKDFRFVMPPVVPSGIDRFTFRNAGTESHMMQLFRLKASYAEFLKALSINPPNIDAIEKTADAVGGAGSIEPGGVQVVKDKITPGHYVAVCFDAGPDGVPHFAKGMIKQFTAASDRGGSWSYAKGVVQLRDFKITLPRHFSGHGTYWVYNKGPSVHEFAIVRLLPGKTLADFVASLSPTYKGPEVTTDAGGFQAINPHHLGQVKLDLPRGHYVATCFVPEANGTPHAALGMYAGFIVH